MTIDDLIQAATQIPLSDKAMKALHVEQRRIRRAKRNEQARIRNELRDYKARSHAEIVGRLAGGETAASVASDFNLTVRVVLAVGHANGLSFKRGPRPSQVPTWRPGKREQDMVAAYKAGQTLEEIGACHGVTRERVRQLIKKTEGVVFGGGRLQAEKRAAEKAASDYAKILCKKERREAIEAAYEAGETLPNIAARFGFAGAASVNSWLRANGIAAKRKPKVAKAA